MMRLNPNDISFPDPLTFDGYEGIVAIGGDLKPERIYFAYQLGIFPWFNPEEEILWWCPDPRFVLFPQHLKVSKSMKKIMDRNIFTFTMNKAYDQVIDNCQKIPRKDQDGTWLSDELKQAFLKFHEFGLAKSVEVWQNNELVGGFYGLQIGKVFCGESMFSKVSNASKAALIYFVNQFKDDIVLIDCQSHTPHLESLGAAMIPKAEFLHILYTNNECE